MVVPIDERGEIRTGDFSETETIRSRHLRTEAFIKAAGRFHYVYGLIVLTLSAYLAFSIHEMTIAFDANGSKMNDWWYWASLTACVASLSVSNLIVGYGLRHLRTWAFRAELTIILLILMVLALISTRFFQHVPIHEIIVDEVLTLLIGSPALVIAYFIAIEDSRVVASADYQMIIARTRSTKVRPALPARVKWSLFLVAAGLAFLYWISMRFFILTLKKL